MKPKSELGLAVERAEKILIATHHSPDGDAIGSSVGLKLALEGIGKTVDFYSRDGIPASLDFLDPEKKCLKQISAGVVYDLAILTDCAATDRVGDAFDHDRPFEKLGTLDHHVPDADPGPLDIIDPEAASAASVVLQFIEDNLIPITAEIATALFVGLMTDTGGFRFENSNPRAFADAAKLVSAGARPAQLASAIFDTMPVARALLLSRALATLTLSAAGRLASISLTAADYKDLDADSSHSENFSNYPRMIEGVKVGVFFREQDGVVRVSLRARDDFDVRRVAQKFGGGGHIKAAGATIESDLSTAIKKITEEIERQFVDQDA